MDATLELSIAALAYGDSGTTGNPARRFFDWSRRLIRAARNPYGRGYEIAPGSSATVFDGTRPTAIGSATEFVLSASALPGASERYRMTWDGTGQNPSFRTDRGLFAGGVALAWAANPNLTETISAAAGTFAPVIVGDVLFVPDTSTGDPAWPGDPLNAGTWSVIGKSSDSSSVQLARPSGAPWSGATESVTPSTNAQVQAFSSVGVQAGDGVRISAGFSAPVAGSYQVLAAAPAYFEFETAKPLPYGAVAVPGVAGMTFYSSLKSFVMVYADQDCHLLLNGGSDPNAAPLSPSSPADQDFVASFLKEGPCWSLVVVNDSLATLNAFVASAE